ncbi:MAG: tRNA pseudouridine(55) synthase TruB [Candidatus Omnitrophota bacterium]
MDGILLIDKPKGLTSHTIVSVIRKRFKVKKVGHAGTLDPMATGVLVLLIGKATKLCSSLIQDDKEYIATLSLGKSTDTQDSTGKIVEEKPVDNIDKDIIEETFNSFLGEYLQIPPMTSAKKHKGIKLYKLARRGKVVARCPSKIVIHDIEILEHRLPDISFRVVCSKGTYIRTLCEDIGKRLGYPAHMSSLRRTRSGRFNLKDAFILDNVNKEDIRHI